jgi:hypothetical protein
MVVKDWTSHYQKTRGEAAAGKHFQCTRDSESQPSSWCLVSLSSIGILSGKPIIVRIYVACGFPMAIGGGLFNVRAKKIRIHFSLFQSCRIGYSK